MLCILLYSALETFVLGRYENKDYYYHYYYVRIMWMQIAWSQAEKTYYISVLDIGLFLSNRNSLVADEGFCYLVISFPLLQYNLLVPSLQVLEEGGKCLWS